MPITWEYFTKRFSISTEEFIRKFDCKSYEDLCSKINHDDILPPAESEVETLFFCSQTRTTGEEASTPAKAGTKETIAGNEIIC